MNDPNRNNPRRPRSPLNDQHHGNERRDNRRAAQSDSSGRSGSQHRQTSPRPNAAARPQANTTQRISRRNQPPGPVPQRNLPPPPPPSAPAPQASSPPRPRTGGTFSTLATQTSGFSGSLNEIVSSQGSPSSRRGGEEPERWRPNAANTSLERQFANVALSDPNRRRPDTANTAATHETWISGSDASSHDHVPPYVQGNFSPRTNAPSFTSSAGGGQPMYPAQQPPGTPHAIERRAAAPPSREGATGAQRSSRTGDGHMRPDTSHGNMMAMTGVPSLSSGSTSHDQAPRSGVGIIRADTAPTETTRHQYEVAPSPGIGRPASEYRAPSPDDKNRRKAQKKSSNSAFDRLKSLRKSKDRDDNPPASGGSGRASGTGSGGRHR